MIEITMCICVLIMVSVSAFCLGFIFCLRAWHLHKVEKIDPVNVVRPRKKISAESEITRQAKIEELLARG